MLPPWRSRRQLARRCNARYRVRAALYGNVTEALARTLRTPQYLILFVSDRCWMRCAHCWFNEAWKERELTQPPLAFAEYEKLAHSIKQLHFLSLTGGEAFQRDDIVELATMFRKTCRLGRYQIPTSGYRTARIVEEPPSGCCSPILTRHFASTCPWTACRPCTTVFVASPMALTGRSRPLRHSTV